MPLPATLLGRAGSGKKSLVPQQSLVCPSPPGRRQAGCSAIFTSVFHLSSPGAAFGTFVILCVGGLIAQALGWPFIFYIFGEPPPLTTPPHVPGAHPTSERRGKSWGVGSSLRPAQETVTQATGSRGIRAASPFRPRVHCGVPTSPYEMPGLLLHVVKVSRLKTCILNSSHVRSYFIIITISAEKPSTYIPYKKPAMLDSNVSSLGDLRDVSCGVRSLSSEVLLIFLLWVGWRVTVFPLLLLQRTVTCSR